MCHWMKLNGSQSDKCRQTVVALTDCLMHVRFAMKMCRIGRADLSGNYQQAQKK